MKRYALFCCRRYYPGGGFNDFIGTYDTVSEAETAASKWVEDEFVCYAHWHVVDLTTGQKVVADVDVDPS